MGATSRQDDRLPVATLVVLAAALFAGVTTEVLPVGLLPEIAGSLHTTAGAIGLLVSGYAVVVALGSVPLALATAGWSRRRTLCWVLAGYALSNLVVAISSSYGVILASRMLAGLAHAALFPIVIAIAVESVPQHRSAHAVAVVNGGVVAALSLGVPIGTTLGTSLGWRWTFAASALIMLALIAAVLVLVSDTTMAPVRQGPPPRSLLGRPALLILAAGIVLLTLGHYAAYTYISPMLLHAGVAAPNVGPVLFGYGVAGVVGLVIAARLGGAHPRASLAAIVALAVFALVAIAGTTGSATGTVMAVVLWGASFGGLPSLLQTAALRLTPKDASIAPALVNSMFNVGIFGGAAIGGRLLGLSPAAPALFAATLMGVSLTVLLRTAEKVTPEQLPILER